MVKFVCNLPLISTILMQFRAIYRMLSILVNESFKDYICVETMNGENKYDAGEHGLQASKVYSPTFAPEFYFVVVVVVVVVLGS